MTSEFCVDSKKALKQFADYKNDYQGKPENINFNGSVIDGKLFNGFENKVLIKEDVIFAIRWTENKSKICFCNFMFSDIDKKSVISSDDCIFSFDGKVLEFTINGSHWTLI